MKAWSFESEAVAIFFTVSFNPEVARRRSGVDPLLGRRGGACPPAPRRSASLMGRGVPLAVQFSPMVTALSWVMNSGLATPPGHCSDSIASLIIKTKSTGP
jgi:hypothetical protein